jgi:hypothetical protein
MAQKVKARQSKYDKINIAKYGKKSKAKQN